MIPATIDPATASPGERDLFKRLRDDADTSDWIVLHSFDLPRHRTQVQGEADFVVLVPGMGMLCVEVKAHTRVSRTADGHWRFGGNPPVSRSPFKQAGDNMHSLLDVLRQRRAAEADAIVTWAAVIFTHCEFRVPAVEWNSWEVLDSRDLSSQPISASINGVLEQARAALPLKARKGIPTAEQCQSVASALRPRFEAIQPSAQRRADQKQELQSYTEEQYAALDGMSSYTRLIFEGPAGTGKTLLALEAARRGAARGQRVGLLCFNRLLGQWLEDEASHLGDLVRTSTIHRLMLDVAGATVPRDIPSDYFEEQLPEMAIEALLNGDAKPLFDTLVVDEAQDILRNSYLDFLDLVCEGGMVSGNWSMFGDFERQALYQSADVDLNDFRSHHPDAGVFKLRVNCRNTPRIASWVAMLAGLDPSYSGIRRPDTGPPPRTRYYEDDKEQLGKLCLLLQDLYDEGFDGRDIVLLSPIRSSAATRVRTAPWKDRIKPFGDGTRGAYIQHETVWAFKGLEAPVVILTDVDAIQGDMARALFYTATTRATEQLHVLAEAHLASEMIDLADRFSPGGAAQ